MTNRLKENWFKSGILIILTVSVAIGIYYFFVFLPASNKAAIEHEMEQATIASYQKQCSEWSANNANNADKVLQKAGDYCNTQPDPTTCIKSSMEKLSELLPPFGQDYIDECVKNMIERHSHISSSSAVN